MHKDVKRSLVAWPLAVSLFTIALAWLAMQPDAVSKLLYAKAGDLWQSFAADQMRAVTPVRSVDPLRKMQSRRKLAASGTVLNRAVLNRAAEMDRLTVDRQPTTPSHSRHQNDVRDELADIVSWTDVSFDLRRPEIVGIPAPTLDRHTDLFGFDDMELNQAGTAINVGRSNGPVIELAGPIADPASPQGQRNEQSRDDEVVIRLDPKVFFADDSPLSDRRLDDRVETISPLLAERPTTRVSLPSAYQAPEASVADMAPEMDASKNRVESNLAENLFESADQLLKRPLSSSPTAQGSISESQPKVPARSRQETGSSDDSSSNGRSLAQARSATWPVTHRLMEQLDTLETIVRQNRLSSRLPHSKLVSSSTDSTTNEDLLEWSANVRHVLGKLPQANRLGDEEVGRLLADLKQSQQYASKTAETLLSRSHRVAWLQAAYAIERRLAVWYPIYRINSGEFPETQHVGDDVLAASDAIDRLEQSLPMTGDEQGWAQFLVLSDLRESFETGDGRDRREVAQKFLSRINWPNLAPIHRQWIASDSVQNVAVSIRPWASGAIDYSALLHQIERAESNAIDLVTAEIAQSMQALRHSSHPQANELAQNLDTRYRNANVRFSISDELLQNLLPKIPSRDVPLRTTLLGSRVTGISRVQSDLQIKLVPSPSTWELSLETRGNVSTRSVGRRGPAAVSTSSVNPYAAATLITIKPTDIQHGNASVDVGGRSRLRGINTTYDSWPLVGSLVQNIAQNEYFEKASLANRIGRNRIRTQVGEEIDRTIGEKVERGSNQFSKTILGPLTDLKLEPRVIDMSSTSSRLIARYRMAGDWQLAAMTPRPRALSDNLFSVQMHQSALNNTLEQLVPQNGVMPIAQVLQQCFDLLGIDQLQLPQDLPEDTLIQFAKHRPITVEIEDGKVWITMRIVRLERGKRLQLRNFIVRAGYKPEIHGLNASLVRDGHLSISGPRMSMRQRLPVRAVFNKVLSPNRPLTLLKTEMFQQRVPEETTITQFELRDGWIGISMGKQTEHQTVASRPAGIR